MNTIIEGDKGVKPADDSETPLEVWAVGGSKGGIGKSFITSGIGTWLALKEKRTILIDADYGGANLHSFFGIDRPEKTLSDFFKNSHPLSDNHKDYQPSRSPHLLNPE